MIRDSITIQEATEFLNEIAAVDPRAMRALLLFAIECNQELAEDPRFTPSKAYDGRIGIGVASLLDSMFGHDEQGRGAFVIKVGKSAVTFGQTAMPTDPEKYAARRQEQRLKGLDPCEYTLDEKRVAKYLTGITPGIGAGGDPIGFLIASHAALRNKLSPETGGHNAV